MEVDKLIGKIMDCELQFDKNSKVEVQIFVRFSNNDGKGSQGYSFSAIHENLVKFMNNFDIWTLEEAVGKICYVNREDGKITELIPILFLEENKDKE